MSIDDIFRLGDRTIAQRLEIDRLRAINKELVAALERTLAALIRTDCFYEIRERSDIVEKARAALAKVE